MPLLSDYLSDPSLLIGFRTMHSMHGNGTVIDIVRESVGHDYVWVQFDKDTNTLQFAADTFLALGAGGSYFTHKIDHMLSIDFELKALHSALQKTATSPIKTRIPVLSESDYLLCFAWAGYSSNRVRNPNAASLRKAIGQYDACRLMSARVAELVAISYYNSLGQIVEDISISQINSNSSSQNWRSHDLLVDGRPVDVKNARKSFSGGNGFVEHCVPQFKNNRESNVEVSILGVLSDYMRADQIENGEGKCVILGEVSVGDIRKLYSWVKRRFGILIDFAGLWRPGYQPGWVFEYSSEFYRNRISSTDGIEDVIHGLRRKGFEGDHFPGWLLALCPGKESFIESSLTPTKQEILNDLYDLRERVGYSRPALFVYSMGYILEAIAQNKLWSDSALILYRMIFAVDNKLKIEDRSESSRLRRPSSICRLFVRCF